MSTATNLGKAQRRSASEPTHPNREPSGHHAKAVTAGAQTGDGQVNVGHNERAVSMAAGGLLTALGLTRGSIPGLLIAGIGGALIHRGYTGYCQLNAALGIDSAHDRTGTDVRRDLERSGIEVKEAMLIDKSPQELYQFWRKLDNLPSFMRHLQSVTVTDDKRSHWVAEAPAIAGGSVEWDAEITRDEPNQAIAWQSLPGSDIDAMGEIRFSKAMGDRGTKVQVSMKYSPPAGRIGHWVAKLFGDSPSGFIREDLHRFKALMEVGEIPSIKGQPRGTCFGGGKRATNEV